MAYTEINMGSTADGNLTGNTVGTETYRAAQTGLIMRQLDTHTHASGWGAGVLRLAAGATGADLTLSSLLDITAGGLRVKGLASAPSADTANTNTELVISAGSNAGALDTYARLSFYRTNTLQGLLGFDDSTATIGGVAMAVADLKFQVGGTYRGFIDNSNSGQLMWGAGGIQTTGPVTLRPTGALVGIDLGDPGVLQIGGNTSRGTTNPTDAINIFNGTAPVGTLANGATFYCAAGEMRVMDAAGNSTLLSPHAEDGSWIYDATSPITGKRLVIQMERFVKAVCERLGMDFVQEFALS